MKLEAKLYTCDICDAGGTSEMIFYDSPNDKYVCYRKECVEKHAEEPDEEPESQWRCPGIGRRG